LRTCVGGCFPLLTVCRPVDKVLNECLSLRGARGAGSRPRNLQPQALRPQDHQPPIPPMPSASAPSVVAPHLAAILAIGDEVLRGEITNTNATFLAERLSDSGLEVCEQRVVADQAPAMRRALEELAQRASIVIVTGGLGPTEDDRTVDVVLDHVGGARRSRTAPRWRR
jgi:hypothetical protein